MQKILFMVNRKRYTAIQQISALKKRYEFKNSQLVVKSNSFTYSFDVRPTPLSDSYRLKIDYKEHSFPKVYVVFPKPLKLAVGAERLPHTYDTKRQLLCLFTPNYGEWNDTMLIANTIVHWAIEWLYYYENWVYTGKWLGGGHGNSDVDEDYKSKTEYLN